MSVMSAFQWGCGLVPHPLLLFLNIRCRDDLKGSGPLGSRCWKPHHPVLHPDMTDMADMLVVTADLDRKLSSLATLPDLLSKRIKFHCLPHLILQ